MGILVKKGQSGLRCDYKVLMEKNFEQKIQSNVYCDKKDRLEQALVNINTFTL